MLLSRGADVNARHNSPKHKDETVLQHARRRGDAEIVALLRRHGATD